VVFWIDRNGNRCKLADAHNLGICRRHGQNTAHCLSARAIPPEGRGGGTKMERQTATIEEYKELLSALKSVHDCPCAYQKYLRREKLGHYCPACTILEKTEKEGGH